MNKRSIIQRGADLVQVNEDGVAGSVVKPGYLVKGVTTIDHATVNSAIGVPKAFALERDELGTGIDDTRQGSGTISAYYASGDTVKVGVFPGGTRFLCFVASGENIAVDTKLESAGDGTLRAYTNGTPIARALEAHAPNVVSGNAAIVAEAL
jgi:hypothetical protein